MKFRNDFVTNSSSSSFIVSKEDITLEQRDKIFNYRELCEDLGLEDWGGWDITENNHDIYGSTSMDNFSMTEFLSKIGVDVNKVRWMY